MGKYARAGRGTRSDVKEPWRGDAVKRFNRSIGEAAGQIGHEAAPCVAEANPRRAKVLEFGAENGGRRGAGDERSIDGGLASYTGRAVIDFNPGDDVEEWKLVIKSGLEAADRPWLTGPVEEATALQRPLPNDAMRIVATGEKSDQAPADE